MKRRREIPAYAGYDVVGGMTGGGVGYDGREGRIRRDGGREFWESRAWPEFDAGLDVGVGSL